MAEEIFGLDSQNLKDLFVVLKGGLKFQYVCISIGNIERIEHALNVDIMDLPANQQD